MLGDRGTQAYIGCCVAVHTSEKGMLQALVARGPLARIPCNHASDEVEGNRVGSREYFLQVCYHLFVLRLDERSREIGQANCRCHVEALLPARWDATDQFRKAMKHISFRSAWEERFTRE